MIGFRKHWYGKECEGRLTDVEILFDERIRVKFSQQISFEACIETPSGKVILK